MTTFQSLGLNASLLEAIELLGFESPTEVQEKVIPILLNKKTDLVALAQTGTGKTAAFGFPLLQHIDTQNHQIQGLILSPTRELCIQINHELQLYGKTLPKLKIVAVYGGANINEQSKKIKRGAHLIVATPGRLKDMINRKLVDISQIQYCVLDEADEMLNMGFYDEINDILTYTPSTKNSWLFSATMPPEISTIAKDFMNKPVEVTVGRKNSSTKNVEHQYYTVASRERYNALRAVLMLNPEMFGCVFCRTKIETQKVAEKLIDDGYKAGALHGDLSQNQRDAVMNAFRKKRIHLLIATDVAARGIDVDDLTHIINYQLPDDAETYTHRSGRTGRAGKQGISIIFANRSDKQKVKRIEKKLQTKIKEMSLPSRETLLKSHIFETVSHFKKTTINPDIEPYLDEIMPAFEDMSKSELIALVLSKQIQKITFPNNLQERISAEADTYKEHKGKINEKKSDVDRFFINIGSRDHYEWTTLKDFVRSYLELDKEDIFKVEVMKNFSFFSAEKRHRELILERFDDLMLDNRSIQVELTKRAKTFAQKKRPKKTKSKQRK